jgi:hypothetical protein
MLMNIVLKLNQMSVLGEDVEEAPRVDCSKLSPVHKEKVMPGVDNQSLFWLNDSHSSTSILRFMLRNIELKLNESSILGEDVDIGSRVDGSKLGPA